MIFIIQEIARVNVCVSEFIELNEYAMLKDTKQEKTSRIIILLLTFSVNCLISFLLILIPFYLYNINRKV